MPRNRSVGRPAPRPTASRSAPPPARVQQAPPPAVPQRSGGSVMGGLASTIAEGMAKSGRRDTTRARLFRIASRRTLMTSASVN
ncbi:hypothetical protein R1flu_001046 [Riccia fluitans]|uniref:Uncharacterized protein n=1 Tax=Riccia fluitans TaxID=41844 RepID=A0ABD1Y262_9MARC